MPGSLRPLNRRGLLGLGAATTLGAALVGCTRFTDPVVHGTNSVTAPPIPSPDPAFVAASDQVVNLLAVLTGVPDSPAWVPGARAMLTAHLDLLTARDPLAGQPTPDPWLTPSPTATPAAGIDQFEKRAAELAASHVTRCGQVPDGDGGLAMFWASLAVATTLNATSGPGPVPGPLPRRVAVADEAGSRNVLLGHLHALAQLLELAVGNTTGESRAGLEARLGEVRGLVTAQQDRIRLLGREPTAPLPGYEFPGPTDTASDIAATLTLVEERVFTAHAPVVASCPGAQRADAIQVMTTQGRVVRGRGRATTYFPGWT